VLSCVVRRKRRIVVLADTVHASRVQLKIRGDVIVIFVWSKNTLGVVVEAIRAKSSATANSAAKLLVVSNLPLRSGEDSVTV
jgi:hypothetical protein